MHKGTVENGRNESAHKSTRRKSKIICWQILTFLLLKIVIILMRLKIKGKWEFKLPAVQYFGHIFKLVSAHLDQNKASPSKAGQDPEYVNYFRCFPKSKQKENTSTISDIFQNQDVIKYVNYFRYFPKSQCQKNSFERQAIDKLSIFESKEGCISIITSCFFTQKEITYPKDERAL